MDTLVFETSKTSEKDPLKKGHLSTKDLTPPHTITKLPKETILMTQRCSLFRGFVVS